MPVVQEPRRQICRGSGLYKNNRQKLQAQSQSKYPPRESHRSLPIEPSPQAMTKALAAAAAGAAVGGAARVAASRVGLLRRLGHQMLSHRSKKRAP